MQMYNIRYGFPNFFGTNAQSVAVFLCKAQPFSAQSAATSGIEWLLCVRNEFVF
jgi:hypothetical protein